MNRIDLTKLAGHDEDFALWSAEQAALLRAGKFDRVDMDHVAEEIESLGRSDKYEIRNRLDVLIAHLLNWQFQEVERSNSWKATISEQRLRIADLLEDSPSLKSFPETKVPGAYIVARYEAMQQTGLPEAVFPASCPYTIEQILDPDFLPGQL